MTREEEAILAFLEENEIPYRRYTHERHDTLPEKLAFDRAHGIEALHCKNLLLCDRKKENPQLLVMPFVKTFRTATVSRQLGVSRLSFAPPELLREKLRCEPGSLSALSLIFDRQNEIRLVLDRELLKEQALCFHPNTDTTTLVIPTGQLTGRFLQKTDRTVSYVDIPNIL